MRYPELGITLYPCYFRSTFDTNVQFLSLSCYKRCTNSFCFVHILSLLFHACGDDMGLGKLGRSLLANPSCHFSPSPHTLQFTMCSILRLLPDWERGMKASVLHKLSSKAIASSEHYSCRKMFEPAYVVLEAYIYGCAAVESQSYHLCLFEYCCKLPDTFEVETPSG